MIVPAKLKKGDTIALISPSSPLTEKEPVEKIAEKIEQLGYHARIGKSCNNSTEKGYAAADPSVRARDLEEAFSDPEIRAIWCVRGGSTAWQMLPFLDFDLIAKNPKPFIGFSDITTLHMAIQQKCDMVTYHGPTANRVLGWESEDDFSLRSLRAALDMDRELMIENPEDEPVLCMRPGCAEGTLTGGNLSLVTASLGTPWQVNAKNRILYLEDVGEAVYALDRMLYQLKYAGVFEEAAGVVLGAFTQCKNAYREGYGPEELLKDFFAGYDKPVLYNVRSAHCAPMVTLPMGANCRIDGQACTMKLWY